MQIDTHEVGRRIASVRALRGMTQAELAKAAEVAEVTVQRAETGRLSIVTIIRLGKTLGTSLDYLVLGKGAP